MQPPRLSEHLTGPLGFAVIVALLASFAYGFVVAELLLFWFLPVVLLASLSLLYLFYRLVRAVEHIAYER